jgi:hypothetical protein
MRRARAIVRKREAGPFCSMYGKAPARMPEDVDGFDIVTGTCLGPQCARRFLRLED